MATVEVPKAKPVPTGDPHFADATSRIKAAVSNLRENGIIDPDGCRIRRDLPADMQENASHNFGG